MKTLTKENINISVDRLGEILDTDLADLCSVTEQAIRAVGGFGWLSIPPRDILASGVVFAHAKMVLYASQALVFFINSL